jgi:hypothetical protein
MGLDIRLPIGLLFSVVGALLVGYGALSNKAIYQRSLGLNINLAWGLSDHPKPANEYHLKTGQRE